MLLHLCFPPGDLRRAVTRSLQASEVNATAVRDHMSYWQFWGVLSGPGELKRGEGRLSHRKPHKQSGLGEFCVPQAPYSCPWGPWHSPPNHLQMPPPRTPPQAQAEWTGADVRVGKSGFLRSNAFTGQKEARDADELSEEKWRWRSEEGAVRALLCFVSAPT